MSFQTRTFISEILRWLYTAVVHACSILCSIGFTFFFLYWQLTLSSYELSVLKINFRICDILNRVDIIRITSWYIIIIPDFEGEYFPFYTFNIKNHKMRIVCIAVPVFNWRFPCSRLNVLFFWSNPGLVFLSADFKATNKTFTTVELLWRRSSDQRKFILFCLICLSYMDGILNDIDTTLMDLSRFW